MKRRGFFGLLAGAGLSKMLPAKVTETVPVKSADKIIEAVAEEVPPVTMTGVPYMPYYSCSAVVFPNWMYHQNTGTRQHSGQVVVVDTTPPLLEAPKED